MALRTHLENIDELIQLHDSRLYALEKNFQEELKTTQSDFNKEREAMTLKFAQVNNIMQLLKRNVNDSM